MEKIKQNKIQHSGHFRHSPVKYDCPENVQGVSKHCQEQSKTILIQRYVAYILIPRKERKKVCMV